MCLEWERDLLEWGIFFFFFFFAPFFSPQNLASIRSPESLTSGKKRKKEEKLLSIQSVVRGGCGERFLKKKKKTSKVQNASGTQALTTPRGEKKKKEKLIR